MPDPRATVNTIIERLEEVYPDATYELEWETPEQMLVATLLAAQCTDERVNKVTRSLFKKYPDPRAFAEANRAELEKDLKPTGFYRQKAKVVQQVNRELVERFGGKAPRTIKELTSIKGVARKSANVVLNCCYDLPTGIIVDTHVARISPRLGLTSEKKPTRVERDLMTLTPREKWTFFGPAMVLHGRYTCTASDPACARCVLLDVCPRNGVPGPKPAARPEPPPRPRVARPRPTSAVVESAAKTPTAVKSAAKAPTAVKSAAKAPAADPTPFNPWIDPLTAQLDQPYFTALLDFIAEERAQHTIYPPEEEVFSAFELTPVDQVRVVVLGQDPYHGPGQAHGLSFSVKPGVSVPPSLKNIYKELKADLGFSPPHHGHLVGWAKQGVLMLNAVLTVRESQPNSHKDRGWETFTDAVIRTLSERHDHLVFLLWGGYARKKRKLINRRKHTIIESAHPSPLSARSGFFGSKPFSKINAALATHDQPVINWRLPITV